MKEEEPQTYTVHITREGGMVRFDDVVAFEPQENAYLLISKLGARIAIPYSNNLIQIEVIPDEMR